MYDAMAQASARTDVAHTSAASASPASAAASSARVVSEPSACARVERALADELLDRARRAQDADGPARVERDVAQVSGAADGATKQAAVGEDGAARRRFPA